VTPLRGYSAREASATILAHGVSRSIKGDVNNKHFPLRLTGGSFCFDSQPRFGTSCGHWFAILQIFL